MTARFFVLVAACMCGALPASAQVRDAPAGPAANGTGTIVGTVQSDEPSPRPVRRAIVTLKATEPRVGRTAVTDDAGRFAFVNLPIAKYTVSASKRGWVSTSYGAKSIGRPGRALQIGTGERATIAMRMAHGAVIAGTILDQFGQPVGGAALRVMRYAYSAATGDRRLTPVFGSSSGPDERGAYRIYGLAPGEYYVVVSNQPAAFLSDRDIHLTSDVDVEEAVKAAQGPSAPAADVPQPSVGFTQIYYPGTPLAAQATPITVRASEERTGVDFAIAYTPTAEVSGTVTGPAGTPMVARVTLVANDPSSPPSGIEGIHNAMSSADGRFRFTDLPPGPYLISASAPGATSTPEVRPQPLSTVADLDVPPDGVPDVSLVLQEGFTVTGSIRLEGSSPPPNLGSLRVLLEPAQNLTTVSISTGGQSTSADGHFALTGISPGRYRLSVLLPPQLTSTWRVRSAALLGQDSLDDGVDVRAGTDDAVIVLSDQLADLSGKVEAPAGGTADYTMILFATDRAQWRARSRRVMTTRVATDGGFSFRNVPPGDYLLAPVDDVEPGEWFDPAFLQGLAPASIHVSIAEGEKKVQDIRVGTGGA